MKQTTALSLLLVICTQTAMAQHDHRQHDLEEMVVNGALQKEKADTVLPVHVMSGEELLENTANTLGDTLNRQVGVQSTSFGPGVGLPVIRGQSGNRVRVLQDGLGTMDVSTISQDHNNSIEPVLAERIEVIRGTATLLYGNGAIGGVVNVIDNRVPQQMPDDVEGKMELRYNNLADEKTGVLKLDGGIGNHIGWHFDGVSRKQDNVEIPGLAIDEHAHEHEEEIENTDGFIANSDGESASFTAGASFIGERGFIGISINRLENEYGIPLGGHVHHHDEEHEEEAEEHDHHHVRLDMDQTRYDIKAALSTDGFLKKFKLVSPITSMSTKNWRFLNQYAIPAPSSIMKVMRRA